MSDNGHLQDNQDGEFSAYVFIPLFDGDVGKATLRGGRAEFVDRTPKGVALSPSQVRVTVSNSGVVASDLITLDWRVRFCTYSGHLPTEGFTVDHAGEAGSVADDFTRLEFLEGGRSFDFVIDLPAPPPGLANVYFQARVSTIWSEKVSPDEWASRFETDPQITEAHISV